MLRALATAFALLGAAIALAVAAMAVASIAGRALWARPIPGDVELTQFGIGCAIALALPWCQWRGSNIIVDFFTQRIGARGRRGLDAAGALAVAVMCALLGWRSGGAQQREGQCQAPQQPRHHFWYLSSSSRASVNICLPGRPRLSMSATQSSTSGAEALTQLSSSLVGTV